MVKDLVVVASMARLVKGALVSSVFVAGMAHAQEWSEECLWPGSWDSAYVPCVSAVDYGNGHVDPGWTGGGSSGGSSGSGNNCYAYNRDGRTCSFVGYSEGQVGTPWGQGAGTFRCTNGCLQYVNQ
ncbi:MAG: hypothetical protein FJ146_02365 [Deltaproteobacteria bacterium]|nr:hypothetical protein [Deltaproteobacteria bacterium]